jgi:hypothetical protein
MELEGSLPCSETEASPKPCVAFRNMIFYVEDLLSPA